MLFRRRAEFLEALAQTSQSAGTTSGSFVGDHSEFPKSNDFPSLNGEHWILWGFMKFRWFIFELT